MTPQVITDQLRNAISEARPRFLAALQNEIIQQFETSGDAGGSPWAPLKDKRHTRAPLLKTGELLILLLDATAKLGPDDFTDATDANALIDAIAKKLQDYAALILKSQHYGTSCIPARPIITDTMIERATQASGLPQQ